MPLPALALVTCAFIGGRLWEHRQAQTVAGNHPQQNQQRVAQPPQRVVVVVLSDHLDRSERLLVELKHADADNDEDAISAARRGAEPFGGKSHLPSKREA